MYRRVIIIRSKSKKKGKDKKQSFDNPIKIVPRHETVKTITMIKAIFPVRSAPLVSARPFVVVAILVGEGFDSSSLVGHLLLDPLVQTPLDSKTKSGSHPSKA